MTSKKLEFIGGSLARVKAELLVLDVAQVKHFWLVQKVLLIPSFMEFIIPILLLLLIQIFRNSQTTGIILERPKEELVVTIVVQVNRSKYY